MEGNEENENEGREIQASQIQKHSLKKINSENGEDDFLN